MSDEADNVTRFKKPDDASEQVEAMNRVARKSKGRTVDGPPPPDAGDDLDDQPSNDVPWIELPRVGRQMSAFAREIAGVCNSNGVFRRGELIVKIDKERKQIAHLDTEQFRTYVEDICVPYKWVSGGRGQPPSQEPATMSGETAKGCLRSPQFISRQRPLNRVHGISQPIQRSDGRIELLQPGYDTEAAIVTMDSGIEVKVMPLEAARCLLRDLLKDFPFVSSLDLAVQIASMVSYYGAMLLAHNAERINFACKANKHRSGKTLLIKITLVPVMGRAVIMPFPSKPEKLEELLNATANDGASYLVLDDITGHVKSPALNAFITASTVGFRGFHTQSNIAVDRQAIVYLSGHEMTLQADLEGRFLECRLHVEEADSQSHRVPRPINERFLARPEQRKDICSALWSLIYHWDAAGRPKGKSSKPGFEEWCDTFGGIVEHAGFGDPCAPRPDEERADGEYSDMAALVTTLLERFSQTDKMKEFTFSELLETCVEKNLLAWKIEGRWKTHTHKSAGGLEAEERFYEASKRCESQLGWLFADKYGGTKFRIGDRKVMFSKQGKNRNRRYTLSLES
jgi:hypothetical protein